MPYLDRGWFRRLLIVGAVIALRGLVSSTLK